MQSNILYLLTRTSLHVGAGPSVGAIDQPIQRERHTGFPIIPATSLKGSFADQWPTNLKDSEGRSVRLTVERGNTGEKGEGVVKDIADAAWLFGSDTTDLSFAGSLIFSEARLLAFPIRSAKGSFAWITCPLLLQRAKRDGVIFGDIPPEPVDDAAIFLKSDDIPVTDHPRIKRAPLAIGDQIVLEEYCFTHTGDYPAALASEIAALISDDLFQSIAERLVIVSNGTMSHFAATTCEVAQHVRISDETGTAEGTGLFNQENVPADTLFYSVLSATGSRVPHPAFREKGATEALVAFTQKLAEVKVFQFGGDASTGLGFTTVTAREPQLA